MERAVGLTLWGEESIFYRALNVLFGVFSNLYSALNVLFGLLRDGRAPVAQIACRIRICVDFVKEVRFACLTRLYHNEGTYVQALFPNARCGTMQFVVRPFVIPPPNLTKEGAKP